MTDQTNRDKPSIIELGVRGFEAISNGFAHLKWVLISTAAIMVIIAGTVVVVKVNHFFNWFGNGVSAVAVKGAEGITTAVKKGSEAKATAIQKTASAKSAVRDTFNQHFEKYELADKKDEAALDKDNPSDTSLSWVERSRSKIKNMFSDDEDEILAEVP